MALRFAFPERFVVGTIGQPGDRTFFLQVRHAGHVVSAKAEKQQVSALAEGLDKILDDLARMVDDGSIPPVVARADDLDPLEVPLTEDFRVGNMTIAWNPDEGSLVVELFSVDDDDEGVVSVSLTPGQARQFSARTHAVVSAGRPACPLCLQPMEPTGHVCPRANGYLPSEFM